MDPDLTAGDKVKPSEVDESATNTSNIPSCSNAAAKDPDEETDNSNPSESYKKAELNAEFLLKNTIKTMIYNKVSQEAAAKGLQIKVALMENQISEIQMKSNMCEKQKLNLEKETEADEKSIEQFQAISQRTSELIEMFKERVDDVHKQIQDSKIMQIYNETIAQHKELESFLSDIRSSKSEKCEQVKVLKEMRAMHQKELDSIVEIYEQNQREFEERKKMNQTLDKILDAASLRNSKLKEKEEFLKQNKISHKQDLENQLYQQEELIKCLRQKLEHHKKEVTDLTQKNTNLESKTKNLVSLKQTTEESILKLIEEQEQESNNLKTKQEVFEKMNKEQEDKIAALKNTYNEQKAELEKNKEIFAELQELHSKTLKSRDVLKENHIQGLEKRDELSSQISEHGNSLHELKLNLASKKFKLTSSKDKLDMMQNKYDDLLIKNKQTIDQISKIKEMSDKQITAHKNRYEQANREYTQSLNEIIKKKEYSLESARYFEEKLTSLKAKLESLQNDLKNEEQERDNLNQLIDTKQKTLDETNTKLEKMKTEEANSRLKSVFKSPNKQNIPKKVKFNNNLFVKSATESSECSSQQTETPMAKHFQDWLLKIKQKNEGSTEIELNKSNTDSSE